MNPSGDYISDIIDEIALEGLDGITLQALWLRLEKRPGFAIKIDDRSRIFLWSLIQQLEDLSMYKLQVPRQDLVICDKFEDRTGEYIYPYCPVEDKAKGIRGSCSTYETRVDVGEEARQSSLAEVERWCNSFVIVASQDKRNHAIIGEGVDLFCELSIIQYCILERLGRARHDGEITQGIHSLQEMKIDSKSMFYHRKMLIKEKLITKQQHFTRQMCPTNKMFVVVSGSLLHLPRFYAIQRSKYNIYLEKVINYLKNKPLFCAEYDEIRQLLGTATNFRKMLQSAEFRQHLHSDIRYPYRKLYPAATVEEWKHKGSDKEKQIRVMQLIDPEVNVQEILQKDEGIDDNTTDGCLDRSNMFLKIPILRQAYAVLEQSGPSGCTQQDIAGYLGQSRLDSRSICRNLERTGEAIVIHEDEGRQRKCRFVLKKYENVGLEEFRREQERLQELMTENTEPEELPVPVENLSTNSEDNTVTVEVLPADYSLKVKTVRLNKEANKKRFKSARLLKRSNLIISAVKESKVIADTSKLMKWIIQEEEKEGISTKMDKKSLLRLLSSLEADGHLKNMKLVLRSNDKEKSLNFVCHPNIGTNHTLVQSVIDQAKLKFFVVGCDVMKKARENLRVTNSSDAKSINESLQQFKHMESISKIVKSLVKDRQAGFSYGYEPKFIRMQELHIFCYYLSYGYEGTTMDQTEAIAAIESQGCCVCENEISRIYHTEIGWKMFVPALPVHDGWGPGWCLMCDILLRMPVGLFVKLVNLRYQADGLEDYLNDPIRRNYLIQYLPLHIRTKLLAERWYMYQMYDVVQLLCYCGLVQMGHQKHKEKDQVFFYVNRHASLLDTRLSKPSYYQTSKDILYDRISFTFDDIAKVKRYWFNLWNIAMNTNLGERTHSQGLKIVVEQPSHKTVLREALLPREPDDAPNCDDGHLPGDCLGAGGIDSSLFCHLKRNWSFNKALTAVRTAAIKKALNPQKTSLGVNQTHRWTVHTVNGETLDVPVGMQQAAKRPRQSRPKIVPKLGKRKMKTTRAAVHRIIKPRKKIMRKPFYDEIDKIALSHLSKQRVDWSSPEDSVLLLCKAAASYITTARVPKFASSQTIRDILHRFCPESKNKTSRACQRRILYVMRNEATARDVAMYLEAVKLDPVIEEKFGKPVQTVGNTIQITDKKNEALKQIFIDLVNYLRDNFQLGKQSELTLPNSIDEVQKMYEMRIPIVNFSKRRYHKDVTSVEDIHINVAEALVFSSLCATQDKASLAYQLYQVYQQYQERFLRSVVDQIRSDGMIAIKKSMKPHTANRDPQHPRYLPLSSAPYQLSISYKQILQQKFPYRVFYESYTTCHELEEDEDPIDMALQKDSGKTAALIELMCMNAVSFDIQAPAQMVILDSEATNDESCKSIFNRYQEDLRSAELSYDGLDQDCRMETVNRTAIKRKRNTSESEPLEKMPRLDLSVDNEVIVSSIDDSYHILAPLAYENSVRDNSSVTSNQQNITARASRILLYMIREQERYSPFDLPQHAHEYIMIKSCQIFCSLDENNESYVIDNDIKTQILAEQKAQFSFDNFDSAHIEKLSTDNGYNQAVCADLCALFALIQRTGELGLTAREASNEFQGDSKLDTFLLLKILVDWKIVLRAGVVVFRYIAAQHSRPWIVQSHKLTRQQREKLSTTEGLLYCANEPTVSTYSTSSDPLQIDKNKISEHKIRRRALRGDAEEMNRALQRIKWDETETVNIAIRPWKRVDGSLNRRTFDAILGSVLCYIQQCPACTMQSVLREFSPALQPVHCRELIEILEKLGCISVVVQTQKKSSLFTRHKKIVSRKPTGLEDDNCITLIPNVDACIRFGQFIGSKQYSTDFLSTKDVQRK